MSSRSSLRQRVAVAAVRGVNWLSRVSGRGSGTVSGGTVGSWICPDLLERLTRDRTVILVSGTNGKTTTTAMTVLGWGGDVTTNSTGANMPAGLVAALVASPHDRTVFEVDEAWLDDVVAKTRPRVVALLNLSRDQLDRSNEVRQMAERWRNCFLHAGAGVVVVANANDPLVVYAALGAQQVRWCDVPTRWLEDAKSCPRCTGPLRFLVDSWNCTCGFAKPVVMTSEIEDELRVGTAHATLQLSVPGQFNQANATLALTALMVVGVDLGAAVTRVNTLRDVAGRFSLRRWRLHTIRLLLAKNPAGFDALMTTVAPEPKDLWIAINARVADGRDPSWLYDVAFEQLRGHRVWCLGDRRLDLATRLEYAGVDFCVVDGDDDLPVSDDPVSLIANYTAFNEWLERSQPC